MFYISLPRTHISKYLLVLLLAAVFSFSRHLKVYVPRIIHKNDFDPDLKRLHCTKIISA